MGKKTIVNESKIAEKMESVDATPPIKEANISIKKRRPWRNKIRKKAAREAKRKQQGNEAFDKGVIGIQNRQSTSEAKKKKKTKKFKVNVVAKADTEVEQLSSATKLNSAMFRYINEKLYTMTGSEAMELFRNDPKAFEVYHKGFESQVKKWPYNPVYGIIQWIRKLDSKDMVVADMGCGDAKIAIALKNIATVHSFDIIALNDNVTACNMSKVPLDNESVDVVVFCLSLMGTNVNEYLREANRILKVGGNLRIAEVSSRFSSVKQFLYAATKLGFSCLSKKLKGDGYFLILDFAKKGKVEQKKPLGLKLKPCLYKKR